MYKLLTEEEKTKIENEYKSRRLVLIMLFILALLFIALIGLIPSYIIAASKERDANASMESLSQSLAGKSTEDLDAWLKEVNTKIKLFSPLQDNDRPFEGFRDIISFKPAGISIIRLTYAKKGAELEYGIEGIAVDRRRLIEFQNNLNASDKFTDARIPVSDLAKDKNISFSLTLTSKK